MAGPGVRALDSLCKFRKVSLISMTAPPVCSDLREIGRLSPDGVPGVHFRVVADDEAHPERRSVRNWMSRFVTPIAAVVVPLRTVLLSHPPLQERKAPGHSIAKHRPAGLSPRTEPRCVGSLFVKPQPPGFAETVIRGPSRQMCLKGHIPPAWFWVVVLRVFRSVDGLDAGKYILRAGSTAPPVLVADGRKLLPTALTRLGRVRGLVDAGVLVMPRGGICGSWCPTNGVINHRTHHSASLTRDEARCP